MESSRGEESYKARECSMMATRKRRNGTEEQAAERGEERGRERERKGTLGHGT